MKKIKENKSMEETDMQINISRSDRFKRQHIEDICYFRICTLYSEIVMLMHYKLLETVSCHTYRLAFISKTMGCHVIIFLTTYMYSDFVLHNSFGEIRIPLIYEF